MATTRERIVGAAVSTLCQQGYAKTTARAIAKAGGFAPGVIYYHFSDLDDLFVATASHTSSARLARYKSLTAGVTSAVTMVSVLRTLYAEDFATGHITAVQELVAAAVTSPRLAEAVREETARWQEFAESVVQSLVDGSPFATFVPVPEVAAAAVGTYLGLEMLSHLHADKYGPDAMFDAAQGLAAIIDTVRQQD